ncbi:MAG: D-alanyl-D-alanine carboxypeptidase [Candidatus Zambryskibacteria bacterium]|nr:D-alanyl-D-alanine carboxypeptidase [Candidatus Zambryskibacteria bacterium]
MNNNQSQLLLPSPKISKVLLAFDAFLLISIIGMFFAINGVFREQMRKEVIQKTITAEIFNNIRLEAKAAYVFDVAKGRVIFKKNENLQLPLASLTKLMTALTALELAPKNSQITIKKEFLKEEGDTGLLPGETWKLKDLMNFSLVVSSNDGARSVASVVGAVNLKTADFDLGRKDFITQMNSVAQKLGLKQMYFINENGLDEGNIAGGYGSASDVANLLRHIIVNKPELLEATKYQSTTISSETKKHLAKNTNEELGQIPGLIASKTGYTALAGGNLAIAFDASIGRPIIVVVVGSTEKGRFSDVQLLVNASLNYIKK